MSSIYVRREDVESWAELSNLIPAGQQLHSVQQAYDARDKRNHNLFILVQILEHETFNYPNGSKRIACTVKEIVRLEANSVELGSWTVQLQICGGYSTGFEQLGIHNNFVALLTNPIIQRPAPKPGFPLRVNESPYKLHLTETSGRGMVPSVCFVRVRNRALGGPTAAPFDARAIIGSNSTPVSRGRIDTGGGHSAVTISRSLGLSSPAVAQRVLNQELRPYNAGEAAVNSHESREAKRPICIPETESDTGWQPSAAQGMTVDQDRRLTCVATGVESVPGASPNEGDKSEGRQPAPIQESSGKDMSSPGSVDVSPARGKENRAAFSGTLSGRKERPGITYTTLETDWLTAGGSRLQQAQPITGIRPIGPSPGRSPDVFASGALLARSSPMGANKRRCSLSSPGSAKRLRISSGEEQRRQLSPVIKANTPMQAGVRPLPWPTDEPEEAVRTYNGLPYSRLRECSKHKAKYHTWAIVSERVEEPTRRKEKIVLRLRIQDESLSTWGDLRESLRFDVLAANLSDIPDIAVGDILRIHHMAVEVFNGVPDGRVYDARSLTVVKGLPGEDIQPVCGKPNFIWSLADSRRVAELRSWYQDSLVSIGYRRLEEVVGEKRFHLACQIQAIHEMFGEGIALRVADGTTSSVSSIRWSEGTQEPLHCTSTNTSQVDIFLLDQATQANFRDLDLEAGSYVLIHGLECRLEKLETSQRLQEMGSQRGDVFIFNLDIRKQGSITLLDSASAQGLELKRRLSAVATHSGQQGEGSAPETSSLSSRVIAALLNTSGFTQMVPQPSPEAASDAVLNFSMGSSPYLPLSPPGSRSIGSRSAHAQKFSQPPAIAVSPVLKSSGTRQLEQNLSVFDGLCSQPQVPSPQNNTPDMFIDNQKPSPMLQKEQAKGSTSASEQTFLQPPGQVKPWRENVSDTTAQLNDVPQHLSGSCPSQQQLSGSCPSQQHLLASVQPSIPSALHSGVSSPMSQIFEELTPPVQFELLEDENDSPPVILGPGVLPDGQRILSRCSSRGSVYLTPNSSPPPPDGKDSQQMITADEESQEVYATARNEAHDRVRDDSLSDGNSCQLLDADQLVERFESLNEETSLRGHVPETVDQVPDTERMSSRSTPARLSSIPAKPHVSVSYATTPLRALLRDARVMLRRIVLTSSTVNLAEPQESREATSYDILSQDKDLESSRSYKKNSPAAASQSESSLSLPIRLPERPESADVEAVTETGSSVVRSMPLSSITGSLSPCSSSTRSPDVRSSPRSSCTGSTALRSSPRLLSTRGRAASVTPSRGSPVVRTTPMTPITEISVLVRRIATPVPAVAASVPEVTVPQLPPTETEPELRDPSHWQDYSVGYKQFLVQYEASRGCTAPGVEMTDDEDSVHGDITEDESSAAETTITVDENLNSRRRLLGFVTDLRNLVPRISCEQLRSCEEGVYRLVCLVSAIHPSHTDSIRGLCSRCGELKRVSEFRSGRKGLVCCAARGKPRIEKIFYFYLMVFDHTNMDEGTPLVVSGAEAVRVLDFTVAEAEKDPDRLAAWYTVHCQLPGDFGIRVLKRGLLREYHVVNTWSRNPALH